MNDPAVRASIQSWGGDPDQIEGFLENAVAISEVVPFSKLWYFEWQEYADKLLQEVLAGHMSVEDGTAKMTERAQQLARRYK